MLQKEVKTMASRGLDGAIIRETVFACVYIGKMFLSPRTSSCEKDMASLCACIIVSVMAFENI
jgi:hypothetical protein